MYGELTKEAPAAVVELSDARLREGLAVLRWGLDEILAGGEPILIIDVGGIDRMSSATIAAVLWVKRCCRARQVRVVVRSPSRRSLDVLRSTGLIGVIDVEGRDGRHTGWTKSIRGAFCA